MWLYTVRGFISIVQVDGTSGEGSRYLVRARRVNDLARILQDLNSISTKAGIEQHRIFYTPNHDYHYRVELSKADVRRLLLAQVEEITYRNFKSEAHKQLGGDFSSMLHEVYRCTLSLKEW